MSQIIMLDGSPHEAQKDPKDDLKLSVFSPAEQVAIIQTVDGNGMPSPMKLVVKTAGSQHWYIIAQNIEPMVLPEAEHEAINDFFRKLAARARLTGGQMGMPVGDVSEFTGVHVQDSIPTAVPMDGAPVNDDTVTVPKDMG